MNSKQKGKTGELEFARLCRERGYDGRRTAQYCGNTGDAADVVGLPGIHAEIKRVERLNLEDAMTQATHDAQKGKLPVVFHRRNRGRWRATMDIDVFFDLYRAWKEE